MATNNHNEEGGGASRVWPDWYASMAAFRISNYWKAIWQLINTLVPYGCLWYLMVCSIQRGYPYAVTLLIALPAAAFLVRIFILFHDCVHGSFFRLKGADTFWGHVLGMLVFTSFENWRFSHLRHHVTYANLETRGFGDIWTLTRREYENSSGIKRLLYRLYRNPLILMGLGALFIFVLQNRLPARKVRRQERMSVLLTNLLIFGLAWGAAQVIGWRTYLLIQVPVLWIAGAAGIWLFYVQHQFPGGYWARKPDWDALRAALEGSSFYKLPALLEWFSGSIGYHHVHHLNSRIPNYQLKRCFDAIPALQAKVPLSLGQSFSCIRLKVWDEDRQEMVGFP